MKVIAKKKRVAVANSTLGYIQPVLKFDDESQSFKPSNNQIDFPNDGEIFIRKGYNFIDNDFDDGDLFIIDDVRENETNYDEDRSGSCLYTATNSTIIALNSWEYIPIFETDFNLEARSAKNINSYKNAIAFFIKDLDFLYGPFTYDIVTLSALPTDYFDSENLPDDDILEETLSDAKDFIFKYELNSIKELIIGDYLVNLQVLLRKKPLENIYFGTKEKIIEWGKKSFSSKLTEVERGILNKLKNLELPTSNSDIEQQKIALFKKYLDETNSWLNIELPKYFNEFLVSAAGSNYIEKYLQDNKELFFNEYRQSDILELENSIRLKSQQLEVLNQNIVDLEEKYVTPDNKVFDGIDDNDVSKLKDIISDVDARTHVLRYYDDSKSLIISKDEVSRLSMRKEVFEEEIAKLSRRLETITTAIRNVKGEIFEDKEFAKKVIDAKIYTDLLNNIDPSQNEILNLKGFEIKPKSFNRIDFSTKQFVEEISSRLEKSSRKIGFNDIVNYLVLINQNFLTIFAGLPGVGKTSLVEKLASVLGCQQNNRYLKIPVGRGWTSGKDLIGYYNPLTKKYQSSKTDLYRFLKICEEDFKQDIEVPSIVLLDEANLSPLEHYWSEFLSISDMDYARIIKTTEKEEISFGAGLRFLATVNYDHTTEMLSDRLISRAPVIKLNVADYILDDMISADSLFSEIFSMSQINTYLSKGSTRDYFKGDIKNKFDSVVKTLQDEESGFGQAVIIGMRKYKAVERFCSVAGNIMEDSNKFTALDYAINQHILPLLNGRGDSYAKRLQELKEKLQGLPQSLKCVNRILQVGNDNFKNYRFFS